MTHVWRLSWREQQGASAPVERMAHRDTQTEAEAFAGRLERTGKVLGEVLVYDIEIEGAA